MHSSLNTVNPTSVVPTGRNAILYVTDAGFALPTIVSALEARRKTPIERADIRIVTIDLSEVEKKRLVELLAPRAIILDNMDESVFSAIDRRFWNKSPVPISSLGRFFMLDCVPDIYERILYLDGDTWPCGEPATLLTLSFHQTPSRPQRTEYTIIETKMGRLGAPLERIFQVSVSTVMLDILTPAFCSRVPPPGAGLAAEAFEFCRQNTEICLYHDQSALNAVAGQRRIRLAPRWNFLYSYRSWGVKANKPPEIMHFAGRPKPWTFLGHEFFATYRDAFLSMEDLGLVLDRPPLADANAVAHDIWWQSIPRSGQDPKILG